MIDVFDFFKISDKCKVSKKIYKKQFLENFKLNSNEKKILKDDINSIKLEYIIKKECLNISPYHDRDREYIEIAFISVDLFDTKRLQQISTIIQNIPYPLIVIYTYQNSITIEVAQKRINKNDSNKLVVQERNFTYWIDTSAITKVEKEFFDTLSLKNHPFTNLYELYKSYEQTILALNASKYTNTLPKDIDKYVLNEVEKIELSINDIMSKIKKADTIRDRVNLNIKLKELKVKLESLKGQML